MDLPISTQLLYSVVSVLFFQQQGGRLALTAAQMDVVFTQRATYAAISVRVRDHQQVEEQ